MLGDLSDLQRKQIEDPQHGIERRVKLAEVQEVLFIFQPLTDDGDLRNGQRPHLTSGDVFIPRNMSREARFLCHNGQMLGARTEWGL